MPVGADSPRAPRVSVILRAYDHAAFVAQAIESVLIQDAPFAFELVISDDCSTDGTREIVADYARRHPELIRTVLPERNVGHQETFRRTLAQTRGELIAYLDGDDYWTSRTKLRRQVDYLDRNPDCASCFHDVSLVYDEAGFPSGSVSPGLSEGRFSLAEILHECFVPSLAAMFRRRVAAALPAWAFESAWIDWLIHIYSAKLGAIGYLPETLAAYRIHPGGMFSGLDRVSQLDEDLRLYERLLAELPERRQLIERCVAYRHCQLAIERLGVPFDACVVLIDPRRELRPYFNGRHVRTLPRRDARPVTELEAIRDAAVDLDTATRDYGPPARLAGGRGCHVVVPRSSAEWVGASPQLSEYLERHAEASWSDDWCAVYELAPLAASGRGRHSSQRLLADVCPRQPLPAGLAGGNLEAPAQDTPLPAHAVAISGWVLGDELRAVAIELESGGELLWRAPVRDARPDVAKAFPERDARAPGFRTTLNTLDVPRPTAIDVLAVLSDGARLPFAQLRLRASDGSEATSPASG